jgi:hypothetical protein
VWLPERGGRTIPPLSLGPSRNTLLIEYVALPFQAEGALRYQYRLDGADSEWSPASQQRVVSYARLAAGSYRLLVRAVTPDGRTSAEPADFPFTIAPPWWHRRRFFVLAALLLGVVVESLHRLRLWRRLALEAIRTRIATDLHDDIGSNLSRIAILSEVARRDLDGGNPSVGERLSGIASASRELVDSMSDIVWAVQPERDPLPELARRMRRIADDVLSARDIELRFEGPDDGDAVVLGPDVRREVFLVFKEAVNNLARHSACHAAEVELGLDDGWLALEVSVAAMMRTLMARLVNVVARGHRGEHLAAAGLVPTGLHHAVHGAVSLELTHLTANPQHHAIGTRGRIVNAMLVGDQRRRPAAQVHQVVPVDIVAREP